MSSGQDGLRSSSLSLQRLDDGSELLSDSSIFIDLILKLLEDSWVHHSCLVGVRHCGADGWRGRQFPESRTIEFYQYENFTFEVNTLREAWNGSSSSGKFITSMKRLLGVHMLCLR